MKRTAGNWNPKEWPVYFVASNIDRIIYAVNIHQYLLVAINELGRPRDEGLTRGFIENGTSVLIDSGVYWLSTQHAEAHGLTMNEALGLAPEKVDGFSDLFDLYVRVVKDLGDRAWGYIEIDQGGRDNKIRTRTKLERIGLRPIPVYHPLNDGWDYFDELCSKYDRICFGNVVMADTATRKRLIATAWERRRKYPHVWIHALGMTPSDITAAFPLNSCDSSTWISGLRWGTHKALLAANTEASDLPEGFIYHRQHETHSDRGSSKASRLCAYDAVMMVKNMQAMAGEQRKVLGADIGLFT